jgi:hypothetical protein
MWEERKEKKIEKGRLQRRAKWMEKKFRSACITVYFLGCG